MFNVFLTVFLFLSLVLVLGGISMILDIVKKEAEVNDVFRSGVMDVLMKQSKINMQIETHLRAISVALNAMTEAEENTKKTIDIVHDLVLDAKTQEKPKRGRKKKEPETREDLEQL